MGVKGLYCSNIEMTNLKYVVKMKSHQADMISSRLAHLDIELTERCNNACIHCLINQPEYDANAYAREMHTDMVRKLLQEAAGLGCMTVRFTGGEPLLRYDFAELYLFTRRLGMWVILFTNARLITPEIAQLLARIPPGRPVEVTVYGMRAESYDAAAATRGAFGEFWRGVSLLREYKIPFVVKQSLLPSNRAEMTEFDAFAAELSAMEGKKPGYAMNFDLRARRDDPLKNRSIAALRLSPVETVAVLARNPEYRRGMREFAGKFMGPPGDKLFACGAGLGVCVDAYGKAQMCMGLRHPEMVFDLSSRAESGDGIQFALDGVFPKWREMRAKNPDYLRRCAVCFLKGLCEQCPAKSWMEHGTLDKPVEYLCQVAHAQAIYLGLLREGERSWELPEPEWRERVAHFVNNELEV